MRPIAYASRSLGPTEKLEFLAFKWAMTEKLREYLLGQRCVVFTDNNLPILLATAKHGATEQRWAAQLMAFDFELRYHSGRSNQNVDALSRQGPVRVSWRKYCLPATVRQAGDAGWVPKWQLPCCLVWLWICIHCRRSRFSVKVLEVWGSSYFQGV